MTGKEEEGGRRREKEGGGGRRREKEGEGGRGREKEGVSTITRGMYSRDIHRAPYGSGGGTNLPYPAIVEHLMATWASVKSQDTGVRDKAAAML